jgi:predicted transcriptional regulator YdeE
MTKHPRETKDTLKVIGISIKTTNANGQAAVDIANLWQKFYSENFLDKIPNKKNNTLLGLYTEYEGDFTQPYQYMICCEVTSLEDVPFDMTSKIIPTADYTILNAKGKFPDCLIQTWETIWKSDLRRSYRNDFEVYQDLNPENANIDVYIGVK